MRKRNEGITLIALVVTIIILIILAGISINLILGDNGIVKKAQSAATEQKQEEAREKLEIVLLELKTDKETKKEYNEEDYIDNKLEQNGMQVEGNIVIVDRWQFQIDRTTLKIVEKGTQITIGEIISAEDISNNPAKYYGREVEYSTKSDITIASIDSIEKLNLLADVDEQLKNEGITWQIFYSDKEHIYLITSDFVKVDGDNYYKVFDTATETLQFMNTQSNWKEYVGNDAEYAVGGPTFTMFRDSWNAKYPENMISGDTGNDESGWSVYYNFTNTNDNLYFKFGNTKVTYGYWLASKSAEDSRYLVYADNYGYLSSYPFAVGDAGVEANLMGLGFRPIVCLKSNIKLQTSNNGFVITNNNDDETQYTYKNPIVPTGFTRINTESASWEDLDGDGNPDGWNNGLVIKDSLENEFVWVPVDGNSVIYNRKYDYKNEFIEVSMGEDYTNDDSLPNGVSNEENQITKYGGFYIARYEAGVPDKNSDPINEEGIPLSQKDAVAWTNIEYVNAKTNAEKMYTTSNVKSGLVTPRAWITACKWIMVNEQNSFNAMQYGNYIGAEEPANVEGYGEKQKTGYSEKWKNRNIYDLFGNVEEWVAGISQYDNYVSICGGKCIDESYSVNEWSGRTQTGYYDTNGGFRVMLYIN